MTRAAARAILGQHMNNIRDLFAKPLAVRLGRAAAKIRDDGLAAGDFKGNESIALILCDGSTMSFQHAFAVFDPKQRAVGVFTEHCGYYCFGMVDMQVRELRDGNVVAQHAW